ncbi:LysE family translocator [Azospirillum sp. SYSU D00513]|uniref:LysE family translocator n=1 Tax=Azospirillum sp. SYSU D00513 TaxID=2812561 RepID=UPI001A976849|nr:LysE family translocator [Azospirillum sp. SYSU D00513]
MSTALWLSMGSFALAASISPGPVNVVALASGVHHGFRASLRHVTGATVGFTLLLLLSGFGLAELLARWPATADAARWAGAAFLLYMAWTLWRAGGAVSGPAGVRPPSLLHGAALQWLNPKAWIAAVAGMSAYGAGEGTGRILLFAAVYFAVCYASIAAWAYAGARLRHLFADAGRMRLFNRAMAVLLAAGAAYTTIP